MVLVGGLVANSENLVISSFYPCCSPLKLRVGNSFQIHPSRIRPPFASPPFLFDVRSFGLGLF